MAINPTVLKATHVDSELLPEWLLPERTRVLTNVKNLQASGQSVVYWMQRDVRTVDNWALFFAMHLAQTKQVPLHVVYVLPPPPSTPESDNDEEPKDPDWMPPMMVDMNMTERHGLFLLGGLEHVHQELQEKNVPLHVLLPKGSDQVGETIRKHVLQTFKPQAIVCDFTPIRHLRQWVEDQTVPLCDDDQIPVFQVDAHNVVPVWVASLKRETAARTLRPKLHKALPQFLTDNYPPFQGNEHLKGSSSTNDLTSAFDRKKYEHYMRMDPKVPAVDWAQPGTDKAMEQFDAFLDNGLKQFTELRNDPNYENVNSNLSPWLNHGHVSFQRLALTVKALKKYANESSSYIEEGLVRRELSDNFLFYSRNDYDSLSTAADWAKETLEAHVDDERDPLYSCHELEHSLTYDDLWNAAQIQLVKEGKLHGFLRMYWAKKILEWTSTPEHALRIAQYLNDRYNLDGRDPNSFVGVDWSIMGIHDQGWKERPIFGKIRYMNYAGCKRKFDVAAFVSKYPPAAENAEKAEQPKSSNDSKDKKKSSSSGKGKNGGRQQTLTEAFSAPKSQTRGQKRKSP